MNSIFHKGRRRAPLSAQHPSLPHSHPLSQVPSPLPESTIEVFQSPAPLLRPRGWTHTTQCSQALIPLSLAREAGLYLTDGCSLEVSIAPATHTDTAEGIRLWGRFDLIEVHLQTQVIEQHTGQLRSKTSKTIPDRLQGVVSNMSLINWP